MISGEKLKVMLSSADMEYYAISCDMLDSGNAQSRCAFRKILEDARGQCGFDAAGAKVFVQVFPSKEGGNVCNKSGRHFKNEFSIPDQPDR